MTCSDLCTCHSDPRTARAHGELLEHFAVCERCPGASGRSDLCQAGRRLYEAMVDTYRVRLRELSKKGPPGSAA
jgi:hypothetical protein